MSTKCTVAAATLVAVLAGPAFAGDQDLVTLLRDSGRYVPDAKLPEWDARTVPGRGYALNRVVHAPARGYASTRVVHAPAHAFASAVTPALRAPVAPRNDFQLQGR